MVTIIEEFDAVSIKNSSIQFRKNGTQEPGTKFGCVGTLSGETEIRELIKRCEGVIAKKKTKPVQMNMTVSAHIPVQVARDFFGLSTEKLKPGIWAYGTLSKGHDFVYTADVVDEFEDLVKLIAFPNSSNAGGFRISVANGEDELAELELTFTALADDLGYFYYEALVDELEDPSVAEEWHTQFTTDLVSSSSVPSP